MLVLEQQDKALTVAADQDAITRVAVAVLVEQVPQIRATEAPVYSTPF
jgi:hypothetical protein